MTIIITKDYGVSMPRGNLLGCVGEHLLRTVTVVHPKFENARYIIKFLYSDNVCYEKEITNGILTLDGSLLRIGGNVKMQFFAYAKDTNDENSSQKIFESEIFTARIGDSIGIKPSSIPTYEQSKDMLDKLLDAFSSIINRPIGFKVSILKAKLNDKITGNSEITLIEPENPTEVNTNGN